MFGKVGAASVKYGENSNHLHLQVVAAIAGYLSEPSFVRTVFVDNSDAVPR